MKVQYWMIPLTSILLGVVIGYSITPDKSVLPLKQESKLERHMIELDAKIEKVEEAVNIIASNVSFSTSNSTLISENSDKQQVFMQKDNRVVEKGTKPVKPMSGVNNSASAPVTAEEQIVVNRLIQDIGDKSLSSHSVIGSENMQAMSLAAQNQVMAEITRRLNSGELRPEEFFGPEYPMH